MPTACELKIAIVDDSRQDRLHIEVLTESILRENNITHSIDSYVDGSELLNALHGGRKYNLLLLDVVMDQMDGIALAKALRDYGNQTMIVFISSSHELACQGYKVNAVRYVLKPLDAEELKEALLYCHREWQTKKEILLPTENGHHRISFKDIQFVEAYDRGTRFVLSGETVYSSVKFSEAVTLLPQSGFIHCHRAFLANAANVKRIRPNEFVMRSGDLVPISKHRYAEVSRRFFDCIAD